MMETQSRSHFSRNIKNIENWLQAETYFKRDSIFVDHFLEQYRIWLIEYSVGRIEEQHLQYKHNY